ncbi:MAG: MBL fold metallo-hydrolase, partial [Spirochaetes bacterium]|nr:MBL fold metallo-hydrolase [Spirochaetota bacterium]
MSDRPWTLTVLVNNYVKGAGLVAEHGLALHLSRGASESILFDTGQTGAALVHNASALDVDLAAIGAVVLSHGHYDHTGGLQAVANAQHSCPLYAHPAAFEPKLKLAPVRREIGMPFSQEELEGAAFAIKRVREPLWLTKDLLTTGEVPRVHDFEKEAVAGFYHASASASASAPAGVLPDP